MRRQRRAAVCGALTCLFAVTANLPAKQKPPAIYRIPLPPAPDFSPMDWVIGEWSGTTIDHEPPGAIQLNAAYDFDKRIVIFRETMSMPATKTLPAVNESWMGILASAAGSQVALHVFTSTGFVIRYRLAIDGAEMHFTPDGGEQPPPGWLFRRVWARTDLNSMTETVQVAPPDKPFFVFYTAKLGRVQPQKAEGGKQ